VNVIVDDPSVNASHSCIRGRANIEAHSQGKHAGLLHFICPSGGVGFMLFPISEGKWQIGIGVSDSIFRRIYHKSMTIILNGVYMSQLIISPPVG